MRWFSSLIQENGLLTHTKPLPGNVVICWESDKRQYALFPSPATVIKHVMKIPPGRRSFHEVICANHPQKPYFDIDAPSSLWDKEQVEVVLNLLKRHIVEVLPMVSLSNIILFCSSDENKRSYHLIVDNWCFMDAKSNGSFCRMIINRLPDNLRGMIDNGLYHEHQCLRLPFSHKHGSSRIKLPTINYPGVFASGIIGYTDECRFLPTFESPKAMRTDVDDVDPRPSFELFMRDEPEGSFEICKVVGSIVVLKRLAPSLCRICERTHDRSSPFLSINAGVTRFHCRRSETSVIIAPCVSLLKPNTSIKQTSVSLSDVLELVKEW